MYARLFKLSVVMTFGEMFLRIVRLITFLILAKFYEPNVFGALNYATNFLLIFYIVGELGINQFLTAKQSKSDVFPDNELIQLAIVKQIFVFFVLLVGILTLCVVNEFKIDRITLAAAMLIFADANLNLVFSFLRAKQFVKNEIYIKFAQSAIYTLPCIVIYFWKINFFDFIFILAISNILLSVFAIKFLIGNVAINFSFNLLYSQVKMHLKNIMPLFLASIFTTIYFKSDTIFIEHMLGASSNGIYTFAYKIIEAVMIAPWMVNAILTPLIARHEIGFVINMLIQFCIGIVCFLVVFFISDPFITMFLNEAYHDSIKIAQILGASMIFMSINSFLFTYTIANNMLWTNAVINFFMMIFNIAFNYSLIPIYGLDAAAYTTILTEAVGTVLVLLFIFYYKKRVVN